MPVLGWWTQMLLVSTGAMLVGSFFPGAAASLKQSLRTARKKTVLAVLAADSYLDGPGIGAGSGSSSRPTAVSIKRSTSKPEPEPSA